MTDFLLTAALVLLAWCGASVVVAALFHLALAPRRAEKAYRRFER